MLESQPSAPTKEKRFAYNLYLDTLVLLVKIAEAVERRGLGHPLADTRFIRKIKADDKIRNLELRYRVEDFPFQGIVSILADKIKDSGAFKNFLKNLDDPNVSSEGIWKEIFNQIVVPSVEFNTLVERRPNFTLRGVERMKEMMDTTFTKFFASRDNVSDALKQLEMSLSKARELYFRLLQLPVDLTFLREQKLDENRYKYLATDEDKNPNMRFVENQLVELLRDNKDIQEYCGSHKIDWLSNDRFMLDSLLKEIVKSPVYEEYMNYPVSDLKSDCEFWRNIYKQVIFNNELFLETLEDKSVFWNDDIDIIGTFVLKTFKRYEDFSSDNNSSPVMEMYKDEEDARFGSELFSRSMSNKDYCRSLIDDAVASSSWDSDRLAFMDVVIIIAALTEILHFPSIPITVSFNEYIEIAKYYSTAKSGVFINGVLASIIERLRAEGKIQKQFD